MHAYTRGKTLRLILPCREDYIFPRPCSELDKLPERRLELRLPRTSFMSLTTSMSECRLFTTTRPLENPL